MTIVGNIFSQMYGPRTRDIAVVRTFRQCCSISVYILLHRPGFPKSLRRRLHHRQTDWGACGLWQPLHPPPPPWTLPLHSFTPPHLPTRQSTLKRTCHPPGSNPEPCDLKSSTLPLSHWGSLYFLHSFVYRNIELIFCLLYAFYHCMIAPLSYEHL